MRSAITILGATGRTGSATIRHLLVQGAPVRALTRDPSSAAARALTELGTEVVVADMDDEASLCTALEGSARLFNVQPAFDDKGRYHGDVELAQGTTVARAAAAAGVEHVVQLSAGRGEPTGLPHFDNKLAIRAAFEQAGLVVTALHPAPFMELMVDPGFAPALSTWGVEPRVVGWDRPLPWVAVDDIGAAAASALTDPTPSQHQTIELVGDVRSLAECRRLIAESTGKQPRRIPVPTWLFRAMVGTEFLDMWRWMIEQGDMERTSGLADVPSWLAGRSTAGTTPPNRH